MRTRARGVQAPHGDLWRDRVYELSGVNRMIEELAKGVRRPIARWELYRRNLGGETPYLPFLITADHLSLGQSHPEPYSTGVEGEDRGFFEVSSSQAGRTRRMLSLQ
ncbi:BQ2448_1286 [Microbotryum intermedium]|uniref:BQ2448_1286 protein n=1 Tax=Microbotryum intermedium TaxID=269621 RepID=A0A238F7P8_9BASI|nr:BQ2448_1286 [Microbotryum intermedium]